MKVAYLIALTLFLPQTLFAEAWTAESAKTAAFQKIEKKMDISVYPSKDPNYQENLKALKEGRKRIGNHFVTPEDFGYVVSELAEDKTPKITMTYGKDGHLMSIRIFSSLDFPRTAGIYCGEEECPCPHNALCAKGELLLVHFFPSKDEAFYFNNEGHLDFHVRNGKEVRD